ncbi:MAG TPA: DUF3048 domain-containing protein [Candidatus Dormibacteraeota bacterium]|nr:DUF3048 domain-containing protein [Candidatus Dormibacteraeota bacterium]
MDSDFKPVKRPAVSGQNKTYAFPETKPPEPVETDSQITPDEDIDLVSDGDDVTEEQIEKNDNSQPETTAAVAPKTKTDWQQKLQKLKLHWPPGKKELAVAVVLLLLCLIGGLLYVTHHHSKKPVAHVVKQVVKPKPPTTVASTLSGLQVNPDLNKLPVTGVMIENSTDARPQSGLSQAMVVFEAVAEGGVTRFLALYQDTSPDSVGPVRSARPYYVQWALGFNAGYAHVGGSPDALADIKSWSVRDLDQFANGGSYQRIPTRAAPHNVYTSIAKLNQLEDTKGYTSSTFTGFARKKEAPSKQPTAKSIDLTLSGPIYNAHYDYNLATNSYNRSEGGAPHTDSNTGAQISPKVVIALVTPESNGALDSSGAYYSNYTVTGNGQAYVFQDGIVTIGQWTKNSSTDQIVFTDATGKPLLLNPGQTWLTAVSSTSKISYTP